MNVSAHEEYGLRCLLRLARISSSGAVPASRISEQEGLSGEYVAKFMHLFKKAVLVESTRGIQGGFKLSKAPAEISLKEILQTLSPHRLHSSDFCEHFSGQQEKCANHSECSIRPLWASVTRHFEVIVESLSLADFLEEEAVVKQKVNRVLLQYLNSSEPAHRAVG